MIKHPFPPVFDEHSEILILGSFPSVKSREQNFFYGHPQNRFWKVVSALFGEHTPETVEAKKVFLLSHRIAVWDVLAGCEIEGSADSTIKNECANDISQILKTADIRKIFVNGKTAEKYYNKHIFPKTKINAICLPSTSPANAAWNLEKLTSAWSIITEK